MYEIITPGEGEYVEKKSRFIGYVASVKSEAEALSQIEQKKKQYYDARHNCSAYRVQGDDGRTVSRFSDDGEPSGTAGKPILEVLEGAELLNVVCVVTRYFGGVLLGTGGLVRAYTASAKAAVEAAGRIERQEGIALTVACSYNDLGKAEYLLRERDIPIVGIDYEAMVTISAMVPCERQAEIAAALTEATAAKAQLAFGEKSGFGVADGKVMLL